MSEFTQKISVIIPAYNIEDLLPKCVRSVAQQDYPAELLQIIVVDDGSTDGTARVADDLAKEAENKKGKKSSDSASAEVKEDNK